MNDTNKIEDIGNKRKRLIFRSWHRGTREMDLLMGSFADKHIPEMEEPFLSQYDEILTHNDPDLYNWITGKEETPANLLNDVMQMLMDHKYA